MTEVLCNGKDRECRRRKAEERDAFETLRSDIQLTALHVGY